MDLDTLVKLSLPELEVYVEGRLRCESHQDPPVISAHDEIPEDYLLEAYINSRQNKLQQFPQQLEAVVHNLLRKTAQNDAPTEKERAYISRLVYLAETSQMNSCSDVILQMVKDSKFQGKSGDHMKDLHRQLLRAFAGLQPEGFLDFWLERFYGEDATYASVYFTGLRGASFWKGLEAVPRLLQLANEHPGLIDLQKSLYGLARQLEVKVQEHLHDLAYQLTKTLYPGKLPDKSNLSPDSLYGVMLCWLDEEMKEHLYNPIQQFAEKTQPKINR